MKYTIEQVKKAAISSINFSELCRKIGCPDSGNSYQILKKRCILWNVDTSHFTGKSHKGSRNPSFIRRKGADDILKDDYIFRANHSLLKRAMIEKGIPYQCNKCDLTHWQGKEITLDIDHINGNRTDNTIKNLRFLCPNCHRQTDTFGSKNKRGKSKSGDSASV